MARAFDGVADGFIAPSSASLTSITTAITVAYWWNPSSAGPSYNRHIVKYTTATPSNTSATFAVQQNTATPDTRYQGLINGTSWTTGTNSAHTINEWQFHVLIWQSGDRPILRRYATNGNMIQEGRSGTNRTGSLPNGPGSLYIGRQASVYVPGRMARLFIHNQMLSDNQITTLLNGTLPVTPSGDYWPLTGTGNTEVGTVNGNVLTATGNPAFYSETGIPNPYTPPAAGKTIRTWNGTAWETRQLLVRNAANTDWVWQ